ncbi:hypothetical protein JQN72_08225 [Phycicoccus sp. CSK15P-2]|uniref:WXG100 family type VII secretion target n=1 Tax=Phycicoccus sp. CSK15P-2 TaxID=2807627 RepID=UPI001950E1CD|nr:WXG100 family type VII secretion target [Phycicoccus sp. CSK15P-2]MBM6404228.1 hypothetical protein [Phycicoccus sp. CSK15P-2]
MPIPDDAPYTPALPDDAGPHERTLHDIYGFSTVLVRMTAEDWGKTADQVETLAADVRSVVGALRGADVPWEGAAADSAYSSLDVLAKALDARASEITDIRKGLESAADAADVARTSYASQVRSISTSVDRSDYETDGSTFNITGYEAALAGRREERDAAAKQVLDRFNASMSGAAGQMPVDAPDDRERVPSSPGAPGSSNPSSYPTSSGPSGGSTTSSQGQVQSTGVRQPPTTVVVEPPQTFPPTTQPPQYPPGTTTPPPVMTPPESSQPGWTPGPTLDGPTDGSTNPGGVGSTTWSGTGSGSSGPGGSGGGLGSAAGVGGLVAGGAGMLGRARGSAFGLGSSGRPVVAAGGSGSTTGRAGSTARGGVTGRTGATGGGAGAAGSRGAAGAGGGRPVVAAGGQGAARGAGGTGARGGRGAGRTVATRLGETRGRGGGVVASGQGAGGRGRSGRSERDEVDVESLTHEDEETWYEGEDDASPPVWR